ncbi:MAG: YIP1 family protein [Thermoanaerobaculia bacterium]|nr:YIP1 family protein [Thermoanaerobaculia bacterium]
MSEAQIPSPVAERPPGSAWGALWGILSAPRETFERLAAKPVWAVCLIVLLALGVAFGVAAVGKVTPEEFLRSIEAQGRPVPPQLEDDPERFLATMQRIQVGAGTLFAALFYFAAAGVFLVLFRLLGSDLRYAQSLSTTLHGLLPLGVAALAGLVVVLGREEISLEELQSGSLVVSNLGFLAGEESGESTRALLASFDLFSLWSLWLLALGFRVVARVSAGAAWGVVGVLWAIGVGLKLVLASIF